MTIKIKLLIYNNEKDEWEPTFMKISTRNIKLDEIMLEVENENYEVWGTPQDLIDFNEEK